MGNFKENFRDVIWRKEIYALLFLVKRIIEMKYKSVEIILDEIRSNKIFLKIL